MKSNKGVGNAPPTEGDEHFCHQRNEMGTDWPLKQK